jgi:hypothetical protein
MAAIPYYLARSEVEASPIVFSESVPIEAAAIPCDIAICVCCRFRSTIAIAPIIVIPHCHVEPNCVSWARPAKPSIEIPTSEKTCINMGLAMGLAQNPTDNTSFKRTVTLQRYSAM